MRITNKHHLPDIVVRKIVQYQKDYSLGRGDTDYSVTQLIRSPLEILLVKRHWEDLVKDASKCLFALFGTALHKILEDNPKEGEIVEKRFFVDILGKKISGQADLLIYDNKASIHKLFDYKTSSVYKVTKKKENIEWEQQLNMLAYLAEKNGFNIDTLKITAFARDWRPSESDRKPDYPPMISNTSFPFWGTEKQEQFLEERVKLFKEAEVLEDDKIPVCSAEERYAEPDKFAVIKNEKPGTQQRSLKNWLRQENALLDAKNRNEKDPKNKYTVQYRPGRPYKKCELYCDAKDVCPFYQSREIKE